MCHSNAIAGETSDQFISRLRQQAQHCDFQDLNDQLRDQLVEKINPPSLRRKLLEQQNIKLVDALKITRAWEAADQQSRQITQDDVNAVSQSQHAAHHDVNRVSQPRAGTAHPHAPWPTRSVVNARSLTYTVGQPQAQVNRGSATIAVAEDIYPVTLHARQTESLVVSAIR